MNPGDINKSLKNLTPVKKGDRIGKAVSSDRLNSIQDIVRALCRGDNVVTGPNIRKKTQEGHFILIGEKGGKKGGADQEDPFEVVRVPKDPNDGSIGDLIGVISDSHVFNSEDRDTYEEDNSDWGLLQDDVVPGDQAAWKSNYLGDKIWLQIELDPSQVIINIDVVHGVVGQGQWDTYPNPIEINDDDPDNVYQQFYHQIIAEITDPDTDPRPGFVITNDASTKVQVTQCLFTDLMMTTAHTTRDADYPNLPLLVAEPWRTLPGTSKDGEADEINDVPTQSDGGEGMTPWSYGTTESIYNFKLEDGSDSNGMKINILDGMFNGVLPQLDGMGDDAFSVDVTEWDPDDGEVDIVLTCEYDMDGSFEANNLSIDAVKPENYPEDEPGHSISIGLGVAYVNPNGQSIDEVRNTWLGDIDVKLAPTEVYAFQMFDSSEANNAKVRIFDGDVIDQDGWGHTPAEMGDDEFEADGLNDGDSIYLRIVHDDNWNITEDVTVEWDQVVPDDEDNVSYIEIGYVEVFLPEGPDETVPQVIPHNTMCGDVFFDPPPPDDVNFNFKLEDASDGPTAQVRVYTGNVFGPQEGDTDFIAGLDGDNNTIFGAYDGMEVYIGIQWDQETDNGISGDNITSMWIANGSTPDDSYLTQYITLGDMAVSFDGDGNAFVDCQNSICGDISIPYPPYLDSDQAAYLFRDVNTGDVVWKKSGIRVSGQTAPNSEDSDYDNIDAIRFEPADDPSANFVEVVDEGIDVDDYHVATIKIPLIPESDPSSDIQVMVSEFGDTHWGDTTDCSDAP